MEATVPVSKAATPAVVDSEIISEKSTEPETKEDQPQQVKDLTVEDKEPSESEDKQPEPDPEPQPSGGIIVFFFAPS